MDTSASETIKRRKIIESKKYLNKVYRHFYGIFLNTSKTLPKGQRIEIGSGAGFLKQVIPSVITSDTLALPFCDMSFPAEKMPFKDNSVSCVYMLNTFHHIKDPSLALSEINRVLKGGGKLIMIEPANTWFSKIIYKNFHHEPFNENAAWKTEGDSPLYDSNQALAWIVFVRDKAKFNKLYPDLLIQKYENHTPLQYVISGGFKTNSFLPYQLFSLVTLVEKVLQALVNQLGLFTTIVCIKR